MPNVSHTSTCRRLACLAFAALAFPGCDESAGGSGTLVFSNRHDTCAVTFKINGDSGHTVWPHRTIKVLDVGAGGLELVFEPDPSTCVLYTRQPDSPFDSGRNICNAYLEDGQEMKMQAVQVNQPGFEQVNVMCPN
jgi:hypothetical protein